MFRVAINRNQLENLDKLATLLAAAPAKIERANDRAAKIAQKKIEADLRRRGRPGRFINVSYSKYGPLGLRFSFDAAKNNGRGGVRRAGGGQYSALWASRIFLNAEQGIPGRRAFTIPKKPPTASGNTQRYVISHSSGRWKKGTRLLGPLRIPAIGPFYFSAKSGMPRKKIQKTAAEIIRAELDKQYKKEFGKIMRSS